MKSFRFYEPGVPLKYEEVRIPKIEDNDVLVNVKATGICGSDLHYIRGRVQPGKTPIILGHEIAGVVEKCGEQVKNVTRGDRVCIHYIVSCGDCIHCSQGNDNKCQMRKSIGHHIDGGFAEYIAVPSRNAFKIPHGISFEEGAIIGCAVTTSFHALIVGEFKPGDTVAVFGLGGVGMHAISWARAFGAGAVIGVDIFDFKLNMAKKMGADHTINSLKENPVEEIKNLTEGLGVDIALEVAGTAKTMEYALMSVCESRYAYGRAISVALQSDDIKIPSAKPLREGAFKRSGDHTRDDLRRVIELVKLKRIDLSQSITHKLPFEELNSGLDLLDEKKEDILRIVVTQ